MDKSSTRKKICPFCQTTEEEFLATGYLGCEKCYEAFKDVLARRFERVQKGDAYIAPVVSETDAIERYETLQSLLKEAVARDDLTRVSEIGAKLRRLRNGGFE